MRPWGPIFAFCTAPRWRSKPTARWTTPTTCWPNWTFVIASLHTSLSQPREQVTDRLLNAIWNPHVDMIAHPTGRLLPDRQGADLDMDMIFESAAATNTILEVNANPARLDLRDVHVRRALPLGVKIAINTDAHNAADMDLPPVRRGHGAARLGHGRFRRQHLARRSPPRLFARQKGTYE